MAETKSVSIEEAFEIVVKLMKEEMQKNKKLTKENKELKKIIKLAIKSGSLDNVGYNACLTLHEYAETILKEINK